ncbi:MAG: hypothetical protein ACRD8U_25510 [Pyrinomonadaceae bacterium]
MKFTASLLLVGLLATGAYSQRPRTLEPEKDTTTPTTPAPTPAAAPKTFKAKYEGGVVGYIKKQDGTLTFDDENNRLLFRDKHQKEVLFIPYKAVLAAYPDTQSRRPTAATVIGHIPVPYGLNIPAWFVRKKYRYLTLNFEDPDTNVSGLTSFKVANKQLLESVLYTLAHKSELTARGEGYIRKKATAQSNP